MGIEQGHNTGTAGILRAAPVLVACLLLAGCFGRDDGADVGRSTMAPGEVAAAKAPLQARTAVDTQTQVREGNGGGGIGSW